jgi:hypothetical protein
MSPRFPKVASRVPRPFFQIAIGLIVTSFSVASVVAQNPFANSQTSPPPTYKGPVFQLSHSYPKSLPTPPMPWRSTLNGKPIASDTAGAYANALKQAVSADMQVLVANYSAWNAAKRGWFNQPWLFSIREPIHGMFQATTTNASLFNDPALSVTYVNNFGAVYYNSSAAQTLGNFWGATAMTPNLTAAAAQFPEGSLIVKLAFTEVTAGQWPAMAGSPSWTIFAQWCDPTTGNFATKNTLFNVQLMQMDVIVKDSQAAPKTGWVFTTLVYDNRVQGNFWDQMIPLGAMWGNDPDVNSPVTPGFRAALNETWVNPASPPYSVATLGWGGRLSGPNDQAVQAAGEYVDPATGKPGTVPVANSSCMSCHSPSQWQFQSFLLPGYVNSSGYYMAVPGSADWFRWFQDRPGTQAMDPPSIALDYDMMFAFKALPAWAKATQQPLDNLRLFMRPSEQLLKKKQATKLQERNYNGLPYKSEKP